MSSWRPGLEITGEEIARPALYPEARAAELMTGQFIDTLASEPPDYGVEFRR